MAEYLASIFGTEKDKQVILCVLQQIFVCKLFYAESNIASTGDFVFWGILFWKKIQNRSQIFNKIASL